MKIIRDVVLNISRTVVTIRIIICWKGNSSPKPANSDTIPTTSKQGDVRGSDATLIITLLCYALLSSAGRIADLIWILIACLIPPSTPFINAKPSQAKLSKACTALKAAASSLAPPRCSSSSSSSKQQWNRCGCTGQTRSPEGSGELCVHACFAGSMVGQGGQEHLRKGCAACVRGTVNPAYSWWICFRFRVNSSEVESLRMSISACNSTGKSINLIKQMAKYFIIKYFSYILFY